MKALIAISNRIDVSEDKVIEKIKLWNKEKVYPVSLIDIQIVDGKITDNMDDVKKIIDDIDYFVQDQIKNTLDIEVLKQNKSVVHSIGKFISTPRIAQTKYFKDLVTRCTTEENRFTTFQQDFTSRIKEMSEAQYKKNETAIREYLVSQLAEQGLTEIVSVALFTNFIDAKRENAIISKTGKMTKASTDMIDREIWTIYEPIKERKELREKISLQQKGFERYLENIETKGATEKLNASIIALKRFAETIVETYPNIIDQSHRTILNKRELCEANIRANIAEEKSSELQKVDNVLLTEVYKIDKTLYSTKKELEDAKCRLGEIYILLQIDSHKKDVAEIGKKFSEKIINMGRSQEPAPTPQIPIPKKSGYFIALEDLEPLTLDSLGDGSEEDAKKELIKRFAFNLEFVELIKKEI